MPLAFSGSNPAATIGSQFLDPIIREIMSPKAHGADPDH
jgi:hypothetical protein